MFIPKGYCFPVEIFPTVPSAFGVPLEVLIQAGIISVPYVQPVSGSFIDLLVFLSTIVNNCSFTVIEHDNLSCIQSIGAFWRPRYGRSSLRM